VPRGTRSSLRANAETRSPLERHDERNAHPVSAGKRRPSRDARRNLGPQERSPSRQPRESELSGEHAVGDLSVSPAACSRRTRCAESVREGDSPVERRANLSSRRLRSRKGSSAKATPQGVCRRRRHRRARPPSMQHEESMLARGGCPYLATNAEVGRTPSGSEKHAVGSGRVGSPATATGRV